MPFEQAFQLSAVCEAARADDFADPAGRGFDQMPRDLQTARDDGGMDRPAVNLPETQFGQPGKPNATPVNWDALFPVADADGVAWYVVECERHQDDLSAITPSYEFLKSKGRA